jgi:hypothetical protein
MKETLIERHDLLKELVFYFKSRGLILIRAFRNTVAGDLQRFPFRKDLESGLVISFSESDLWNPDDNEQNWILTAGKIQNLRTAVKKLNGLEVPANSVFSFWRHVGYPGRRQGYVTGREIREGCIVPTVAGGLCQLSNALYDAALKAGFAIVERHKHTKVISGSLAEVGRDATVKWNYIDLRFRSASPFRIDIDLTADRLIVKFRGAETHQPSQHVPPPVTLQQPSKLNDCYSCGNVECFKHPGKVVLEKRKAATTFVLDERWGEYEEYINKTATPGDRFIVPFLPAQFLKINRYVWNLPGKKNATAVPLAALYRSLYIRLFSGGRSNIFSSMLRLDRKVAIQMLEHIPVESTHVVISQNLLPFAWAAGVLGGRTFDVLMSRLPMEKLHERLDAAYNHYPSSSTLNDFRAPHELVQVESMALTKSRRIITPHREIAGLFNNKSILLDWNYPRLAANARHQGTKILFPASALGRKGAYEMRRLALELKLAVTITGAATEEDSFWNGITVEKAGTNPFSDVQLVVYPTYIEHQPRLLLKAIALGLPVITTTACGLPESDQVIVIPVGDYTALKHVVMEKLNAGIYQIADNPAVIGN